MLATCCEKSILEQMSDLHVAAYNGNADWLRQLLVGESNTDARDQTGFTPLHWASFRAAVTDQVPVIRLLIENGADPNAVTRDGKSTCLIFAVTSGNLEAVSALVSGGSDPNRDADGVTPLMVAARDGNKEMVRILINLGARPSKRCGSFTASDYASHGGHDDLAAMLNAMANS